MIVEKRKDGYYAKNSMSEGYLYSYSSDGDYFYRIGIYSSYDSNEIAQLLKDGSLIILPNITTYIK